MTLRAFVVCLLLAGPLLPQAVRRAVPMRPVLRGREYAVSSMKPESTQVAERILRAGGNAFDAAVAGQAVLGLVDAANNGVGADAVLLVYDAAGKKAFSVNAEGTAPRLATIEWFQKNQGGKIPVSDTLLSGTVPGVVDAWYTLLDRWGTMTFAQVLAPAIEMAERGFPLNDRLAGALAGSKKLRKYPSSAQTYYPGGRTWKAGDLAANPDLAATLKKLVDAEREAAPRGRRAALRAARDRFYKGRRGTGWPAPPSPRSGRRRRVPQPASSPVRAPRRAQPSAQTLAAARWRPAPAAAWPRRRRPSPDAARRSATTRPREAVPTRAGRAGRPRASDGWRGCRRAIPAGGIRRPGCPTHPGRWRRRAPAPSPRYPAQPARAPWPRPRHRRR